jgi:hypothetical protein
MQTNLENASVFVFGVDAAAYDRTGQLAVARPPGLSASRWLRGATIHRGPDSHGLCRSSFVLGSDAYGVSVQTSCVVSGGVRRGTTGSRMITSPKSWRSTCTCDGSVRRATEAAAGGVMVSLFTAWRHVRIASSNHSTPPAGPLHLAPVVGFARAFCIPSFPRFLFLRCWPPSSPSGPRSPARATPHCRGQRLRRHITASPPGRRAVSQLTQSHTRARLTTPPGPLSDAYTSIDASIFCCCTQRPRNPATRPPCARFVCCCRSRPALWRFRFYCTWSSATSMKRSSMSTAQKRRNRGAGSAPCSPSRRQARSSRPPPLSASPTTTPHSSSPARLPLGLHCHPPA